MMIEQERSQIVKALEQERETSLFHIENPDRAIDSASVEECEFTGGKVYFITFDRETWTYSFEFSQGFLRSFGVV